MAKKPKTKKLGVKALLDLMGVDPNEAVPAGIKEAEWFTKEENGEPERPALERCPTSGKVCFSSESQAKTAARKRLNKGSNVSRLRAFHCPECHTWHLTSQFRSKRP